MVDGNRDQGEVVADGCGCGPKMRAMMMACCGRPEWSEGAGIDPEDERPSESAGA